jgi:hypothetical protein
MPEPVTTAASVAALLPTTLLLMFFVTPPVKVESGDTKTKLEAKNVWTLQNTIKMDFKTPDACKKIGMKIIDEIEPVVTLTVRAYCICENGIGENKCPDDTWSTLRVTGQRIQDTVPTIETLGKSRAPRPLRRHR